MLPNEKQKVSGGINKVLGFKCETVFLFGWEKGEGRVHSKFEHPLEPK
jgi:hypothetical protein